jgi:predicted nucleic acid-binding protein
VTEPIAERWGILAGQSLLRGKTIKVADGLIAATALHHDLTIVTRNVKDFEYLRGGASQSLGVLKQQQEVRYTVFY